MKKMILAVLFLLIAGPSAKAQWQIGQRGFKPISIAGGGGVTPSVDGTLQADANPSGPNITIAITVPTAGDVVLVGLAAHDVFAAAPTDGVNTYTLIWQGSDASNPAFVSLYYAKNAAVGAINIVSSTSSGALEGFALAITGASTTSPLDTTFSTTFFTSSPSGTGVNGSCGTARTPSQNNTLVISYGLWDNTTPSVGAGYTLLSTTDFLYLQTQSQTTATATTGAWVDLTADDSLVGCAGFHS